MKNNKLKLKFEKETIANLNMKNTKGGTIPTATLTVDIVTWTTDITGDIDIPTIGHDDGPWCFSAEAGWCRGV